MGIFRGCSHAEKGGLPDVTGTNSLRYRTSIAANCNVKMSNTDKRNNREAQRGMGNGRSWKPRGRGQARGLSHMSLQGSVLMPQTAAQQAEATAPSEAQTTRRRMNLMASVSRSSGLQKDGDE